MHDTRLHRARTHNLNDVSLDLRPGELICLTGVSGAGKSSLALDTLYAEGQRRFVESFSPYARQYLERLERPPMESLEPVAAGIAVDRRAPSKSARSTVATLADVEAYLSALFTREAVPVCPTCGVEAVLLDARGAAANVIKEQAGAKAVLGFRVRAAGTAEFLDVRDRLLRGGFRKILSAGETKDLEGLPPSEAIDPSGFVMVAIDRLEIKPASLSRITSALENAWEQADGEAIVFVPAPIVVRRGLVCPKCARTFEPPVAGLFSYQTPVGACAACRGFGRTLGIDYDKVIPDHSLPLAKGAIRPWSGASTTWERDFLEKFCKRRKIPMTAAWRDLTAAQRQLVLDGEGDWEEGKYPGVKAWFAWLETRTYKMHVRVLLARYRIATLCESCHGARLNERALTYRTGSLHIGQWHALELAEVAERLHALKTRTGQGDLARRELAMRVDYLVRAGLGYLSLDRQARTLSGGEAQRVSLTAALGSSLTGALFVLDEPTVGLHPSDVPPLIDAMRELSNRGNIALVVEHDPLVISRADRVIEMGPGAGAMGGNVCFDGTPGALAKRTDLPTGKLLSGASRHDRKRRKGAGAIRIKGARANNLRDVGVEIPLGVFCAMTGPSGSGKSTLVNEVLYRTLARRFGDRDVEVPGEVTEVAAPASIKAVELVDQSPLGRTSRGNPATYTKAWDRVRVLFGAEPLAHEKGMSDGHFSFNVAAGRCDACNGEGSETVEMQFLADVALPCPACRGLRFKDSVLEVRHRGRNVADVLAMTIEEAKAFFAGERDIVRALDAVSAVGLGYLALGQPLNTLSGGEAQRLKLARAMSEQAKGTLFIIDEPSAGLHDADVGQVIEALHGLVEAGGSVVVVDHDLAVMRAADWIIDLGPGAGKNGGSVVAEGTPEAVAKTKTLTGKALSESLERLPIPKPAPRPKLERAIVVEHAREHNLHDVSCRIPLGKLVVVTGPSGSGKSSLAFDVIFAEGQRRFLETLSPYARQFLPAMPRPDVERVTGIPPSVALEQRTSRAGGTSTVATVTEVAHYLRLLFAKLGEPHCPNDGTAITTVHPDTLFAKLREMPGKRTLLAPVVQSRKGTYLDIFAAAARAGIAEAIVDGERVKTDDPPRLRKTQEHDIDLAIFEGNFRDLSREVFEDALAKGKSSLRVAWGTNTQLLSTSRTCPRCGFAVPEMDPRWFSFNTKQGRCEDCEGTGIEGGPPEDPEASIETCTTCDGTRLAKVPRAVRLEGAGYAEVVGESVKSALGRVETWRFEGDSKTIGEPSRQELVRRLEFLDRVGLGYLSLDRAASTLSGGEMQRLRLSAQLGAGLTGALYVLDEPTIGLHPRDTKLLLANLRALVDTGSTVMVVEHDADTIRAADHLVDVGPTGGRGGGRIVAEGPPSIVLADDRSPTAHALRETLEIKTETRSKATQWIDLTGAVANNLKNVHFRVPVGRMTVVSGVSGSGKSTLVRQVFFPAMREALGLAGATPGAFGKLKGAGVIKRVLAVDQSPIGRTPRSVPATFLGIFDELRRLYAATPEAKVRGYSPARFSFNSNAGGRCLACDGAGAISHEMSFLPDVSTPCEACGGLRYEPSTSEVKWRGLSIGEVLRLSADEATEFFASQPKIRNPVACLSDLGVGYLQLGQASNTLSGGEAQRLKLALELTAGTRHEPTLYVLDEPTTGLHVADVKRLIAFLDRLVDRGDTLVIIEHHPAVIAAADHLIELGPDGGDAGGRIVAEGTPLHVSKAKTPTGAVLRDLG